MLGILCRRQKRGLFSPVFAFLKEHSRGYVTEKRGKMAEKEPFLIRCENPQHVLSAVSGLNFAIVEARRRSALISDFRFVSISDFRFVSISDFRFVSISDCRLNFRLEIFYLKN